MNSRRGVILSCLRYLGTLPLVSVFPLFGVAKVCGTDIGIEFLSCAGSVSVIAIAFTYGRRTPRPLPFLKRNPKTVLQA